MSETEDPRNVEEEYVNWEFDDGTIAKVPKWLDDKVNYSLEHPEERIPWKPR